MKKLDLVQMEDLQGGISACGWMGIAGGVLGVAAMCTNPLTFAGGVALGYSLSFGVAGIGCGIAGK